MYSCTLCCRIRKVKNKNNNNDSLHFILLCINMKFRAPVLVAIALIEEGMDPLDSVAFVRKHRQGAINKRQLKYLESYKRRRNQASCIIS